MATNLITVDRYSANPDEDLKTSKATMEEAVQKGKSAREKLAGLRKAVEQDPGSIQLRQDAQKNAFHERVELLEAVQGIIDDTKEAIKKLRQEGKLNQRKAVEKTVEEDKKYWKINLKVPVRKKSDGGIKFTEKREFEYRIPKVYHKIVVIGIILYVLLFGVEINSNLLTVLQLLGF